MQVSECLAIAKASIGVKKTCSRKKNLIDGLMKRTLMEISNVF